jgi:hypothetical protein
VYPQQFGQQQQQQQAPVAPQPSIAYSATPQVPAFSANSWHQQPLQPVVITASPLFQTPALPSTSVLHVGTAHSSTLNNGPAVQLQPSSQTSWTSFNGTQAIGPTTLDPFDVAWAAKASAANNNNNAIPATRSFHVNL